MASAKKTETMCVEMSLCVVSKKWVLDSEKGACVVRVATRRLCYVTSREMHHHEPDG